MLKNIFSKGDAQASDKSADGAQDATILIVDDSPTEVHVFKKILEQGGYKTVTAEDGQIGLDVARSLHPDLILMDVVMPNLNGFQATRKLRNDAETANIPVIMVTTKDQQTDINWGMRQGANAYMVKPIAPAELIDKIKELLHG